MTLDVNSGWLVGAPTAVHPALAAAGPDRKQALPYLSGDTVAQARWFIPAVGEALKLDLSPPL